MRRRSGRVFRLHSPEVKTDGGYAVVRLPTKRGTTPDSALTFFDTAIHEFVHIRDYQSGAPFIYRIPGSDKTLQHRRRPHEIRAEDAVYDAHVQLGRSPRLRQRIDALLQNLAQAIAASYPEKSYEQRHFESSRRYHYKYCINGCEYCRNGISRLAPPKPSDTAINSPA